VGCCVGYCELAEDLQAPAGGQCARLKVLANFKWAKEHGPLLAGCDNAVEGV
jgi:hypothetical protein